MCIDISFIVPVYNTEPQKLLRCFSSIQKIDHSQIDYECLVLDDGSGHETHSYCKEFCNCNKRFLYVRKKNEGVSATRNLGIDLAKGQYTYFVDSDDEIEHTYFSKEVLNSNADLVFSYMQMIENSNKRIAAKINTAEAFLNIANILKCISSDVSMNTPTCKLLKKEYLETHNIRFNHEMKTGEDLHFLLQILAHNPTMYNSNKLSYYYHYNLSTTDNRVIGNPVLILNNNVLNFHALQILLKKHIQEEALFNSLLTLYSRHSKSIACDCMLLASAKRLTSEYKLNYRQAMQELNPSVISHCGLRTRIEYQLITGEHWRFLKFIAFLRKLYLSKVKPLLH